MKDEKMCLVGFAPSINFFDANVEAQPSLMVYQSGHDDVRKILISPPYMPSKLICRLSGLAAALPSSLA